MSFSHESFLGSSCAKCGVQQRRSESVWRDGWITSCSDICELNGVFTPTWREAQRQTLLKAVAFYANSENWKSTSTGFAAQYDRQKSPVEKDNGTIAREALK